MVRKDGESSVEIVMNDWGKSETRKYAVIPGEVAVLRCGNIVMVDTVGNCFIYSPDGLKTLASFRFLLCCIFPFNPSVQLMGCLSQDVPSSFNV